jgi:hypothetical protein
MLNIFSLTYFAIWISSPLKYLSFRNEDQWKRIKDTDVNLCSHTHLIFDKGAKNMTEKDSLFNNCCWENWISA